ncbi:anthocyanin 3'-O-beta-glucosyltransferase-like [Macadamia integrifolia]|uniref:anthocyanin 3'-O-beta-glucosyltransferase-like n=1 Tax=Macadamia integrifolia TaxID=60698 RepID=UPI001C4F54F0|nr:anthocyanin 3'-O-beta-glucosyltransferase-like [Macadamia integrifolia]
MLWSPDHDNSFSKAVSEASQHEVDSWGVIVNSFMEIEGPHVPTFESFFVNGAKSWCVGPLMLCDPPAEPIQPENTMCTKWLAEQAMQESVIYVAFGTQADLSDAQLDEVAFGLEMSGLSVARVGPEGIVGREAISEGVRELMRGEEGKNARERVKELSRVARKSVQEGGSSYENLSRLLDQLELQGSSLTSGSVLH